MPVFHTKPFMRFARREGIDNASLIAAVRRIEDGLIDAELGGGVIKQRIARPGEGKSGAVRTIILFKREERAFFVFGFAKKDRSNLQANELKAFKALAAVMLEYTDRELNLAIANETIFEVHDG